MLSSGYKEGGPRWGQGYLNSFREPRALGWQPLATFGLGEIGCDCKIASLDGSSLQYWQTWCGLHLCERAGQAR